MTAALVPMRRTTPSRPDVADAVVAALFVNRPSVPGLDEPARMLAVPAGTRVLVAGATRENRAETLSSLRDAFVIGGPLALLVGGDVGRRVDWRGGAHRAEVSGRQGTSQRTLGKMEEARLAGGC